MTNEKRGIPPQTPEICPVRGESVPRDAPGCPECGGDHNSGWKEDADTYDGVDLSEDDFNYNDFLQEEFESHAKPAGLKTIWWILGIILIVAFVLYFSVGR